MLAGCCPRPEGLRIGSWWLPGEELDRAAAMLAKSFPAYGPATIRWRLLDGGMGAATILHGRHPEASRRAHREAERWAARLRAGEPAATLEFELAQSKGEDLPVTQFFPPHPAALGGAVAAHVAALEPGQSTGPIRTRAGWEVVQLVDRAPGDRSRANVVIHRLLVRVGFPEDAALAREDWSRLPISGSQESLSVVPMEELRRRGSRF
ncbi:MAG TPA: hypothetical protein VGC54_05455 [Planctomycetota bacterium]